MSVFKTTFSRALAVIKSDNANIPFPAVVESGTNTSTGASQLIDSAATFVTNGVATGDIVYNTTDGSAATVVSVTDETTLVLNANIFAATAKTYAVYQASAQTGLGNTGCYLYVGGAGNIVVTTIGGDVLTFSGVTAGSVLPVQVTKVASATTATLINALW
jgi:hypothetical protein